MEVAIAIGILLTIVLCGLIWSWWYGDTRPPPYFALLLGLLSSTAHAQTATLVSGAREKQLRSLIPKTSDERINKLLTDPRLILYTRTEMPLVYFQNGFFRDGNYDIGPANAIRPHNGAREFPWKDPGGTHRSPNSASFKAMLLPKGKKIAVRTYRTIDVTRSGNVYQPFLTGRTHPAWIFPKGTFFAEILLLSDAQDRLYAYEMRVREKEGKEWGVDVFRPFPTSMSLLAAKELPLNNPVAQHLMTTRLTRGRLHQRRHFSRQSFDVSAPVDILPSFGDDNLVRKLLARRFDSSLGEYWRGKCFAPTTRARFSIIPTSYNGGFLGNDRQGCKKCHDSTNLDVNRFAFGRDWYGNVRGSDRILSFTIAGPRRLIRDAARPRSRHWRSQLNPRLAAILEPYDRRKHADYRYTSRN